MLNRLYSYFLDEYRLKKASLLYKRALYLFVLFKCIQWLSVYSVFFGSDSVVLTRDTQMLYLYQRPAFLLYELKGHYAGMFFILPTLVLAVLGWMKKGPPYIGDLILWLLVINIHNRIYPALTGAEVLLNQLLLFSSFIGTKFDENKTTDWLKKCIHNFGVMSVMLQICYVYMVSALTKMTDPVWQDGGALIQTLSTPQYSNAFLMRLAGSLPALFVVLNYVVMIYQLTFPLLIWFKRIKKPMILLGLIIHLFIAFGMGLFSFGVVMILSYFIFWPFEEE